MVKQLLVLLALGACQGNRDAGPPVASGSAPAPEPERDAAGSAEPDPIVTPEDGGVKPEEPEPPDPSKLIAELGAIPAWQAVIDRAQLLGRRNQRGVVFGRIGAAILVPAEPDPDPVDAGVGRPPAKPLDAGMVASPYVWLIDDTEGNGSLGIRIALAGTPANPGDRVALGGAWELDEQRHWFWKVTSIQALPPPPPSDLKDPPPAEPSHVVKDGSLMYGARMVTLARDGDAIYFQIVGPPPANDGDGWLIANELGDRPFAQLTLPGERASYGGQDMRAADERWQLKRAQTYRVRIGKVRNRGPDKLVLMHARTGPIRIP